MKRKLTDNIPLKIMSVIVGILIWLIVVNVDNPIDTQSYTITNIELINRDYVDDMDKMVRLDDKQTSVRVYITAERKTLERISAADIQAVADLQQAVDFNTDPVMVPIVATCPGIRPDKIRVTPQNLGVSLEDKVSQEFLVNVKWDGTPAKGYEVASMTASPEKVRITGPRSLISKIDKVNASIKIGGRSDDRTESVSLKIIDKNQEEISASQMNNLRIENSGKVMVTSKLWKVRSNVKIRADYSGQPAYGYQVERITTVPDTLSVAGSDEALAELKLNDNTLWIQGDSIDISGEDNDIEQKISIAELLPEGLKLPTGSSEDVWVKITILPVGSHAYSYATKDIQVKNKPEDMLVAFEMDKLEIRVKAADGNMDKFDMDRIKASIDLDEKKEGTFEVPVKVELPFGYELLKEVTTEVTISEVSSVDEK